VLFIRCKPTDHDVRPKKEQFKEPERTKELPPPVRPPRAPRLCSALLPPLPPFPDLCYRWLHCDRWKRKSRYCPMSRKSNPRLRLCRRVPNRSAALRPALRAQRLHRPRKRQRRVRRVRLRPRRRPHLPRPLRPKPRPPLLLLRSHCLLRREPLRRPVWPVPRPLLPRPKPLPLRPAPRRRLLAASMPRALSAIPPPLQLLFPLVVYVA
jgi:hypothetical protein